MISYLHYGLPGGCGFSEFIKEISAIIPEKMLSLGNFRESFEIYYLLDISVRHRPLLKIQQLAITVSIRTPVVSHFFALLMLPGNKQWLILG